VLRLKRYNSQGLQKSTKTNNFI